jgi:ATP-dependent DNA ligase
VQLFTRKGFDWTDRYPLVRKAVSALRTSSGTIDGEAVCCDEAGVAVFSKRCSSMPSTCWSSTARTGGARPLGERKARLAKLLAKVRAGIVYSEHLEGDGAEIFKPTPAGIVSKHREHPYRSGLSKAWLKTKNPAAPGMLRFREEP